MWAACRPDLPAKFSASGSSFMSHHRRLIQGKVKRSRISEHNQNPAQVTGTSHRRAKKDRVRGWHRLIRDIYETSRVSGAGVHRVMRFCFILLGKRAADIPTDAECFGSVLYANTGGDPRDRGRGWGDELRAVGFPKAPTRQSAAFDREIERAPGRRSRRSSRRREHLPRYLDLRGWWLATTLVLISICNSC